MDHTQAVADFCGVTGATDARAREFLETSGWNVAEAAANYFAVMEGAQDGGDNDLEQDEQTTDPQTPAVPQTPASSRATASSAHRQPPRTPKKFGSLRDLQGEGASGDGEDEDDKEQEYFAGGDKSGLAVQDPSQGGGPRDQIQRLLDTARRHAPAREQEDAATQRSYFTGTGQTLGGDDVPSEVVPDPNAARPRQPAMVERTLHLWQDGFSVDDGPLYRYDDPANARTLDMINRGSAPLDIMNVESGQAVDVKLDTHRNQPYVQPKRKYQPFGGSGQRLGSPGPGITSPSSSTSAAHAATTRDSTTTAATPASNPVDETQPTLTLQIRLADGTRLPSRFNVTQTVGDVYSFVDRSSAASVGRPYTLATTFPTKELSDKSQVLGEMAEFKRGGVVVQKWS